MSKGLRKLNVVVFVLLLLVLPNCSRLKYDITPDAQAIYHSLRLKFNVKNLHTGEGQNFKVLLKYNDKGDKMLFLSPLNQIYGILLVEDERALLVNTKRKRYWSGDFRYLLKYMWGEDMDFRYTQFKQLVTLGIIPQRIIKAKGIDITQEKATDSEAPKTITITNTDVRIKVKIADRKSASGALSLAMDIKPMTRGSIRDLLE